MDTHAAQKCSLHRRHFLWCSEKVDLAPHPLQAVPMLPRAEKRALKPSGEGADSSWGAAIKLRGPAAEEDGARSARRREISGE